MNARRAIAALGCGLLFAIGLGISGMTHPRKVLDFLDVTGRWDPSLLFVMGGAMGLCLLLFPRILARPRPRLDTRFHLPPTRPIDLRLCIGAAIFGVGWGIAGYCPGPVLVTAASGARSAILFVLAMLAGMVLFAVTLGRKRAGD